MANVDDRTLEEMRNEKFESFYESLEDDQDRLNWFIDMRKLQSTTSYHIMTREQEDRFEYLLSEFFNPKNEIGEPDHEKFAERMDLFYEARIQSRAEAGWQARGDTAFGIFAGSEEKSYLNVMQGELNLRNQQLDGLLPRIAEEYKDPYAERLGVNPPDIPDANEADIRNARYDTAMGEGFAKCEESYLKNATKGTKDSYLWQQDMEKKLAKIDESKVFSTEELKRVDAHRGPIWDQEIERIMSETSYDLQSETKDSLAQFNTKRSWIFFGRESKEHANLRMAAEDFQSKLQAYQEAEKKSPSERLKAVKDLEEASDKMEKLASVYEEKKGSVRTEAGEVRLQGALNLKQLGKETKWRMGKAAKNLEAVVSIEAQKDKKIEGKEAGTDGRRKTNVNEIANKFDMNREEQKTGQKHRDKSRSKQHVKEGPEPEMGGEG